MAFTISGRGIPTGGILDGAITSAKINSSGLAANSIASDAVSTAKIADDAVTEAKWGGNQLSHRNLIINGDMKIAQRGTSGTNTDDSQFPSIDRWLTRTYNGTGRVTLAQQSINSNGFKNSVRVTPSTTDTSGTYGYNLGQYIEGYNTDHLNWGTSSAQTITLSFWVKSSETGTFSVSFRNGAGDRSWVSSYSISTSDTFEYKTITVTGSTDGTWATDTNASILLEFCYGGQTSKSTSSLDQWVTGNYTAATGQTDIMQSTSNYFEITGVQLEMGSVATPFEHRSYGEELAKCQRYYEIASGGWYGYPAGQSNHRISVPYKATKRAAPTLTKLVSSENCASGVDVLGGHEDETASGRVQATNLFLTGADKYFYAKFSADSELS